MRAEVRPRTPIAPIAAAPPPDVGRTPLVDLTRCTSGVPARISVKLESRNPTGSVKDRVAWALVDEAERQGRLGPGATLVAATAGNMGLALARLGAARGLRVHLVVPEPWSHERLALLLYGGADVTITPGSGLQAAVERACRIAQGLAGAVLLDQFSSPANPEVHRTTTAREIWTDTRGDVSAFVAGVGTGGTLLGVAAGLRELQPRLLTVAVEPARSAVLSGGKPGAHGIVGIGGGFVPPLFRFDRVDEVLTVTDEDAYTWAQRLAREEGILAGVSSGANVAGAVALARRPGMRGKRIVTLVCDSAERYVLAPRFETQRALRRGGR